MILMALDHVRDFFGTASTNPRDVTDVALFVTRWVTHFCAPLFIFLAGMSAFLYGSRGRSRSEIRNFLLSRGVWLVFLEFTIIRFGWSFSINFNLLVGQVIWAIGCSMIVLAGLIYLPRRVLIILSLTVIAGHNLLDLAPFQSYFETTTVGRILHHPGTITVFADIKMYVVYPLIPWIAVMSLGYSLGFLCLQEPVKRRRSFLKIGLVACGLFVVLRSINVYGDPQAWVIQEHWFSTLLSFLNCEKYPPSFLYILMTLGPGIIGLVVFDRVWGGIGKIFITIGRVPMMYYIIHLPLIHGLAVVVSLIAHGHATGLIDGFPTSAYRAQYGWSLLGVYLAWLSVLVMLYPICVWFAGVKKRRKDWWLSYL